MLFTFREYFFKEQINVPITTDRTDSLEVRTPGESPGDVGSTPSPFIINYISLFFIKDFIDVC